MTQWLKQSTAFIFRSGPFVDSTDGVTAETALTIAQADIQISKAGAAFAQTSATTPTTTHDADGWYQCPFTTTDTGTLGTLDVQIAMTGALPVWKHFMVMPANVFDSLVSGSAADLLDVSTVQLAGTAQTARDIGASVLLSMGTGTGQLDFTSGVVKASLVQILASAITGTAAQIAAAFTKFFDKAAPTGTINSLPDAVAGAAGGIFIAGTNAATSITTALTANITGSLSGAVGSVTGAVGSVTGAVGSVTGAVATVTALGAQAKLDVNAEVDTALNTAIPGTPTADSVNQRLVAIDVLTEASGTGDLAAILTDTGTTLDDLIDTEIGAIKAVTDKLDTALELDGAVYRYTTNALEQAPAGSGTSDWSADERTTIRTILGIPASGTTPAAPTAGALKVIDDFLDTEIATLLTYAAGSGPITFVYTLTNSGSGLPISDALVQAYTEAAMSNLSASGRTAADGTVTFYLTAGTYYLKRTKSGFSFTNPDTEVVA